MYIFCPMYIFLCSWVKWEIHELNVLMRNMTKDAGIKTDCLKQEVPMVEKSCVVYIEWESCWKKSWKRLEATRRLPDACGFPLYNNLNLLCKHTYAIILVPPGLSLLVWYNNNVQSNNQAVKCEYSNKETVPVLNSVIASMHLHATS